MFKGVVSNFLMVVKVIILCFFFFFFFFFLKFRHQVPFIRVKKPSLGWKRGGKKKRGKGKIN